MIALFACPRCRAPLEQVAPNKLLCRPDELRFYNIDGIWHFLLPERAAYYDRFIQEYETIRRAEGRGSSGAAHYRALPYQALNGNMVADWKIRAKSFEALLERVVIPFERANKLLRVLDLGAGNGWLTNRLALRGHAVAAVDLMINDFDGLGCHRFYESTFTPIQAEFDQLPFLDHSADAIIFNASLHYSVNIQKTLEAALRVLDEGGQLVILDSPIYRDPDSGARMIAERESHFQQRYGFPSNALPSQNYLTYALLENLENELNIKWTMMTPFYGISWWLRPVRAALTGGREPAKFHVLIGQHIK